MPAGNGTHTKPYRKSLDRHRRNQENPADVLALVTQGLPKAQSARRVHMTEAGVKTYGSRILTELGCANRVRAALLLRAAPFPSWSQETAGSSGLRAKARL
ncbi:LuxR C-terminal-related transcriptional regulator [Streptosporangium sp. NPDC048047]|uniref:LuxR C-terminal-related transcriptional regulator n=1 Tax=Streptosporangium sp. NPDC048047 TaxID=3155748 RepID=UPI0034287F1F